MNARGILMSGQMVRALLREAEQKGTGKSQTRRVVNPQPSVVYRLTDDSIRVYHTGYEHRIEEDTRIAERRLPGGIGWKDLLVHQIRWIWSQGARGLVPVTGAPIAEGIPDGIAVPQQPEGYQKCSPADLLSLSRSAAEALLADTTLERKPRGQPPGESGVGYSSGELGRQEGTRERKRRREAPDVKAQGHRTGTYTVGRQERIVQPATSCACPWYVTVGNIRRMPWEVGQLLYVRETHSRPWEDGDLSFGCFYRADYPDGRFPLGDDIAYWTPSIYMLREHSRLTLRITDVRVERVQEITPDDARSEGLWNSSQDYRREVVIWRDSVEALDRINRKYFGKLWDSINAKPKLTHHNPYSGAVETCYVSYPWEEIREVREHRGLTWYVVGNPCVWPLTFDVIAKNVDDVIKEDS